jgi:hypothetical protein
MNTWRRTEADFEYDGERKYEGQDKIIPATQRSSSALFNHPSWGSKKSPYG